MAAHTASDAPDRLLDAAADGQSRRTAGDLTGAFKPAQWLQDVGRTSWFLVGFFLLIAGLVWLLGATATIVVPLTGATVVAAITMPAVAGLARHRVPRAVGAALVLLALVAAGVVVVVLVVGGVNSQQDAMASYATQAADKAAAWLKDVGVSEQGAATAKDDVVAAVPQIVGTMVDGAISGLKGLTSLVFGLSLAALSLFFLLKDGPSLRGWVDGHLGIPKPVAQTITGGVIRSLRGYFRGVTIVAVFNAVVVGLGALLLDVPLAGTIAIVTFVTAYVPYIGAFAAGAFTVVIALGSQGTTTALVMLVIFLLANGLLQNLVQPFAMGSALDLHPLVVLVVTIAAGCVFGTIGLILAAPLVSAAAHINRDLSRAHARAAAAPD